MARRQFEPLAMGTWGTGKQGPLGRGKLIEILFLSKINNQMWDQAIYCRRNDHHRALLPRYRPATCYLFQKNCAILQISHSWFCSQPALKKSKSVSVTAPFSSSDSSHDEEDEEDEEDDDEDEKDRLRSTVRYYSNHFSFLLLGHSELFDFDFPGIIPFLNMYIRVQGTVTVPKKYDKNHPSRWPLCCSSSASQRRHQGGWFLWIGSPYLTSSKVGPRTPWLSNQAISYVHSGARLLRVPEDNRVTSRWLDGNIPDKCVVSLSWICQDLSHVRGSSCQVEPSRPQWMRRSLQIYRPWGFWCFSLQHLLWQRRVPVLLQAVSFVPFRPVRQYAFSKIKR